MGDIRFRVEVKAAGEVRDADGNLVNPVTASRVIEGTAAELAEQGIRIPQVRNKEKIQ